MSPTHNINDVMYSDTFFVSVKFIRGSNVSQMSAFKNSKFYRLVLIHKEASAPEVYEDCIRAVDAPNKTVIDNAQVLTGTKWTNINCRLYITTSLIIPKHKHHNYYEQVGGNFKFVVLKPFHNTPHPPVFYWSYTVRFLDKTCLCSFHPSIGDRCVYEVIKVEISDISLFRLYWFESIWFYNPQSTFPKDKL